VIHLSPPFARFHSIHCLLQTVNSVLKVEAATRQKRHEPTLYSPFSVCPCNLPAAEPPPNNMDQHGKRISLSSIFGQYLTAKMSNKIISRTQAQGWSTFRLKNHNDSNGVRTRKLHVLHKPLQKLCYDTIGDFPDNPMTPDDVKFEEPFCALLHYRKKLEDMGSERFSNDKTSQCHLQRLLAWTR